jgi:hypothetical protein
VIWSSSADGSDQWRAKKAITVVIAFSIMKRSVERLGRAAASAGQEKNDAADDADTTGDGTNRHWMLFFLVHLKRTELRHIFLGGEAGESAPGD